MDKTETELQQEVQRLQAEVSRLRRVVVWGFVLIALAVVFPGALTYVAAVALTSLLALLISPVRHSVFPSLFPKQSGKT